MADMQLAATVAGRGLDVEFSVAAGEVLAILGPNGAGKSTALHIIAGLLWPDTGKVLVGGRTLTDTAANIQIATHRRRVGLLLQDPLLFPHLNVVENVAFAPRAHGVGRRGSATIAMRLLEDVGMAEAAHSRPAELSGGQAQRVAIARALAAEPDVLLIDEPLAGVDIGVATAVRGALRRVVAKQGRSTVLVTHDLLDVLALADKVLVLESGRASQSGPVAEVLAAPRSQFGAQIAGVNLVGGTVAGPGVLRSPSGALWHGIPAEDIERDQPAVAVFPPTAVAVYRDFPHGSPRNVAQTTVAEVTAVGGTVRVRGVEQPGGGAALAADITVGAAAELRLASGDQVWLSVKATEVRLHRISHSAVDSL